MKAVLISINPKWCDLIASGKKTIEIRKNKPKLETPFKVYIYCTKARERFFHNGIGETLDDLYRMPSGEIKFGYSGELMCCNQPYGKDNFLNGKVIGEFVCDKIESIEIRHFTVFGHENIYTAVGKNPDYKWLKHSCLSYSEVVKYGKLAPLYGWHITDLVIYDKPKELYDFVNYDKHEACLKKNCFSGDCWRCPNNAIVVRPPQSWCFVKLNERERES